MSDGPNTADLLHTVLTVSHGNINVDTTTGVTIVGGANGSSSVTLSGTAAQITAALASTSTNYTGTLNYYGPDSLSVTTTDTVNNATSATKTVAIQVADTTTVSEAVPASLSGNENTAISLSGISVSDGPNTADLLHTVLTVSHGNINVDTTTGVTIVGGANGSSSVTLSGTAAQITAALASTSTNYTGTLNYYGPDSLSVTTTDTVNNATSATKTVAIQVADTTTVSETVPASLSGNENTAISLSGISVSDGPNTADLLHTVLTVSHGNINVDTTTGVTIVGGASGSSSVTLSGTAAQITAALASTSTNYTGTLNYYGPDSLSVTTTDTVNNATSATKTVAIQVADTTTVSETVPASLSGNENTAISLSGISVSDGPNTADLLHTVLTVSHGNINVDTTTGVTIVGGASGSSSVTLSGTAAQITAALASTSTNYTGTLNYYGPDSLSVTTTDTVNNATSATKTVAIQVADTTTVSETVPASLSGQREHRDLAERDFGVGWTEHRRPAAHGADGVARQYQRGHDDRRDHRRRRQRHQLGDAERHGGADYRGAGKHEHELHRHPQLLRPRQPVGDHDRHSQQRHFGNEDGGDPGRRYDDGVGGGACLAERQREHRDLAERDFGVGWTEHRRPAAHGADGVARQYQRGHDDRRDHRRRRQRQQLGDAERHGGADYRGAGKHEHELHRHPQLLRPRQPVGDHDRHSQQRHFGNEDGGDPGRRYDDGVGDGAYLDWPSTRTPRSR